MRRLISSSILCAVWCLSAPALAHELDPGTLELCVGDTRYVRIDDPMDCTATVLARVIDPRVASVDPPDPVSGVDQGEFAVTAITEGDTDVLFSWQGEGGPCTEVGDGTVHVIVRAADDPRCAAVLEVEMSPTTRNAVNQKVTRVEATLVSSGCECSRVIIIQTIQIGTDPPRADVDPAMTGVDTPFYNYDPATMTRVPRDGLGQPGTCEPGGESATLIDVPAQTNQPVVWEMCAVCCDDGRVLDCQRWSYDPTAPGGVDEDGYPWNGRYRRDGRILGPSAEGAAAHVSAIDAYLVRNPGAAADACVATVRAALGGEPPPAPAPAPPSSDGGCAVARSTAPSALALTVWMAALTWLRARRRRAAASA